MRRRWLVPVLLLACALPGVTACGNDDGSPEVRVFAAASLTDAFEEIGAEFSAQSGARVRFNFAGSPTLVAQAIEGARADVLALADDENMQAARDAGVVGDEGAIFARNQLVIAVPADNPAGISSLEDLAIDGIKLILALEDVPVGRYAREVLMKAGAEPGTPDTLVGDVLANLVSEEPNVKAIVAKLQLGEADAGIVYASDITDAVASDVSAIVIPPERNVTASYPIAVAADAGDASAAAAFVAYVRSERGQAILAKHGFLGAE